MEVCMGKIEAYLIIAIFLVGMSPLAGFSQNADKSDTLRAELASYQEKRTIPVQEALLRLEQHYDVIFLYDSQLIKNKGVQYKDPLPPDVLEAANELLQGYNVRVVRLNDHSYAILPESHPQKSVLQRFQVEIEGTVTDASTGETLPGVNVLIKGTTTGTSTDGGGRFSLTVESLQDTLIFSFVGYQTQEVPINGRIEVNVALQSQAIAGEELVVVGYGEQKKVNLTGAVSAVEGQEIANRPAVGTMDALQGVMPGVVVTKSSGSPGNEDFNIQIRGLTSVNNNPALVLIDGVEGSIEDVRPEDIESISVLKDAAAASIYGAKAAGGVILVTTKRGTPGDVNVEYNSYFSLSQIARLPERTSSVQKAEMLNLAVVNAGGSPPVSQDILDKLADPGIQYEVDPTNANRWLFYGNYNDADIALKEFTPQQSHNLAISGGSETTTYRISGTYFQNDGILKIGFDRNERYSGRLNLDTKIGDHLTLSNNLSYARNLIEKPSGNDLEGRNGLFSDIFHSPGVTPLQDPNGNFTQGTRLGAFDARNRLYEYTRAVGKDERDQNNLRLNSKLTIDDLAEGLTLSIVGVTDANFDNSFIQRNPLYQYGVDGTTQVDVLFDANNIYKDQTKSVFKEFQFLADYDLTISNHNIHVLGGYSFQDYRREFTGAEAQGLVNKNIPDFDWASNEGILLDDNVVTNAFQSAFGRLNYNYRERYLFEANVRYDGSSKLSPENRYQLFPSVSVGWRLSEESWFDLGFIHEFKLRGSWGQLGNAGVLGNYDYIPLMNTGDDLILSWEEQRAQYVNQPTLASGNLTWETVEISNIGLDVGLFDSRLTITGDYFVKRNKEMLARVAYPSVIGIGVPNQNVGELKTWGWEASISWRQYVSDDFNYWISGNIADTQNELVEYLGADVIGEGTVGLLEGKPVNAIYGYQTDGFFQSQEEVDNHAFQDNRTGAGDVKYVDLDGDGNINPGNQTVQDHGDLVYLGNSNPRYTFGLRAGFNWNRFDFTIFMQGVGKRIFMMDQFSMMPFYRPWLYPQKQHLDYWTEDNRDAYWPRPYTYDRGDLNFKTSEKWIQDAAYVRLKDIKIGYTFSPDITSRAGIERLRIYLAGHDIWETTKTFDYIDPETPNEATFMYPFRRKYTAGINITF